jgi:hypothetical protein
MREALAPEAKDLCEGLGGRLCTASELIAEEGEPEECSYGSIYSWTWVATPDNTCPNANQSYGVSGGNGAWCVPHNIVQLYISFIMAD